MSAEYQGKDLKDIAKEAERDLASDKLKHGAQDSGYGGKTVSGGSTSSASASFPHTSTTNISQPRSRASTSP